MSELITTLFIGISAFIATNIDDIVILLLLFSQINSSFRYRHILAGQYLGFIVLILASLPGLFGRLIISPHWIGLLGLIPLGMGISALINREENKTPEIAISTAEPNATNSLNLFTSQTYSVAAITIANGSDNISVYIPLFASSSFSNFLIIISVFLLLIAVWCYLAYKFTHQDKIADFLNRYSQELLPFVLIILGTIIVLKTQALSLIKLAASCLCLAVILKKDKTISTN